MTLLLIYLTIAIGVSFLCSILEAVLLSTMFIPLIIKQEYCKVEHWLMHQNEIKEWLFKTGIVLVILQPR